MMTPFNPPDLPNGIYAEVVDRASFRTVIMTIWDQVFNQAIPRTDSIPEERKKLQQELSERFEQGNASLFLLIREKASHQAIGWIWGEQHDHMTYYLRNSGLIPPYRRMGIYTALQSAIIAQLKKDGYERVVSDHHPHNRPMLILKLRTGYQIQGVSVDERWGPLVRVVYFMHEDRTARFLDRFELRAY